MWISGWNDSHRIRISFAFIRILRERMRTDANGMRILRELRSDDKLVFRKQLLGLATIVHFSSSS